MDTLIDTNHINELAALLNLIMIFDVDTTMEKYTLSWHDNHVQAVIGLNERQVFDSNWYRSTKNVGEGWVSEGPIIMDFSRKHTKVGNVKDFSILLMHLMAADHTFVGATSEDLVEVYKLFRVFLLIHFE